MEREFEGTLQGMKPCVDLCMKTKTDEMLVGGVVFCLDNGPLISKNALDRASQMCFKADGIRRSTRYLERFELQHEMIKDTSTAYKLEERKIKTAYLNAALVELK